MMRNTLLVAFASVSLANGSILSGVSVQPDSPTGPRGAVSAVRAGEEPGWDALASRFGGTKADTKACKDVTMSFTIPVDVREVLVKGGQNVKKGEMLVRARDDEQVAMVAAQELQAGNRNRIKNAELQKELADLNFKRIEEAKLQGVTNPVEFDQRRIEAAAAAVAVAQETTNHELEKQRLVQAQGLLARYRLEAPWDGIVEEVRVESGQGVRESDPAMRIVDISRLKMDAYAPTQETIRLGMTKGHKAWILVALPDKPRMVEGTVIEVSPVADSVSQTRRIGVEFENTEMWPAGLPVMVRFTDPGETWTAYRGGGAVVGGASVSDAR